MLNTAITQSMEILAVPSEYRGEDNVTLTVKIFPWINKQVVCEICDTARESYWNLPLNDPGAEQKQKALFWCRGSYGVFEWDGWCSVWEKGETGDVREIQKN